REHAALSSRLDDVADPSEDHRNSSSSYVEGVARMPQRLPATRNRLLSTLFRHLPGAWVDPKHNELISLYRLRFRMALEEQKHDTAMIFLNKIIELDPSDMEAKLAKAELYHHGLHDYP